MDSDEEELRNTANAIRERKKLIVQKHRADHGRNRIVAPKKALAKVKVWRRCAVQRRS